MFKKNLFVSFYYMEAKKQGMGYIVLNSKKPKSKKDFDAIIKEIGIKFKLRAKNISIVNYKKV